jgi:hypothetical protein
MKIKSKKKYENIINLKVYKSSKFRKQRNLLFFIALIELIYILTNIL